MRKTLFSAVDRTVRETVGPVVDDLTDRHERGKATVKRMLGFYVCKKCNHSQVQAFAICPKCGHPHPGPWRAKKK